MTIIPLAGKLEDPDAEVSGLAWYGDHLIILPQYPDRYRDGTMGSLFALTKAEITAYIDGGAGPLVPRRVAIDDQQLNASLQLDWYEGYEAIAFYGDRAYLTLEAGVSGGFSGVLVTGTMNPSITELSLDVTPVAPIVSQSHVSSMAEESIVVTDDAVLTIHEANGESPNPSPVAHAFDRSLRMPTFIAFPQVEYRITDTTAPDAEGRFWAINHFWPGDSALLPARDPIAEKYGTGTTHAQHEYVERLIELELTGSDEILLGERAPLQLQLADEARNWEGIVRLDDRGFLLMTDEHPTTLLAFVSLD